MNVNKIFSKNLYHVIKKQNLTQRALSDYMKEYPNSKRVIGTLPYDWIKDIPKAEIPSMLASVDNAISAFAKMVSAIRTNENGFAVRGAKVRLKKFQRQLQNDLQKILNREDVSVEYSGSGSFKQCHKVSVGDFKYALSTFFRKDGVLQEEYSEYFNIYKQGKGYEPQNSFTLYKNGGHGRWAKPFIAKIAGEYDLDGFILSKYIDSSRKSKYVPSIFEMRHLKIRNDDFANRNLVNGVFVDVGGSFFNPEYINNKNLKNIWQGVARRFDETNSLISARKYRWMDEAIVEDITCGIDIFDKDYVLDFNYCYILSKKEKSVFKKIVENLTYANKMVKKAEKDGVKSELVNILNKDMQEEFPYTEELWYGLGEKYYSKAYAKVLGVSNKSSPKEFISSCYDMDSR